MRSAHPLLATIALLTCAAHPASAQHAHFAAQFGVSAPLSGLKDAVVNPGMTVGIMVPIEFGGGHQLRPRLDFTGYNESDLGKYGKATTLFIGTDYLFHASGRDQGFYVLGGLGYQRSKFSNSNGGFAGVGYNGEPLYTGSGGAPAYALGLGWQFTDLFGMELRYTASRPSIDTEVSFLSGSPAYREGKVNTNAVNLSFTFTWGR